MLNGFNNTAAFTVRIKSHTGFESFIVCPYNPVEYVESPKPDLGSK
jgi:hypothetical protein